MVAKAVGGGTVGVCWVVMEIGKGRGVGVLIQASMRVGRGLADQNAGGWGAGG